MAVLNCSSMASILHQDNVSSTIAGSDSSVYCDQDWVDFRNWLYPIYLIINPIVCVFGIVTNIVNIFILTRKEMISSTNTILTGLAIADLLVMINCLPFTLLEVSSTKLDNCAFHTYGRSLFELFYSHISVLCHTISIGLTLTLATWRFIAITFPLKSRELCSMRRALIAVICCYAFTPFLFLPIFLGIEIREEPHNCTRAEGDSLLNFIYYLDFRKTTFSEDQLLKINMWFYGVLIKLVPCIALTVLSVCLIHALHRANRERILLTSHMENNTNRSSDHITRMLLAILLLFLVTEFPHGILSLMSGIFGQSFYKQCYINLGEVVDLLSLVNSAINFILYCVMSSQFRNTCSRLFKPSIFK